MTLLKELAVKAALGVTQFGWVGRIFSTDALAEGMMSKRRQRFLWTAALAVAASLGLHAWWADREPVFQDRKLSEWLAQVEELERYHIRDESGEPARSRWESQHREASAAVHSIGPNAIPWLLKWLRTAPRPGPLAMKLEELLEQQSWIKLRLPERQDRSGLAYVGFCVLRSNAVSAIPHLSSLLARPAHAAEAAACLGAIGPAAFPALARGLTNSDLRVQQEVLMILLQEERRLGPVLPVVVNAITNGICPLGEWAARHLADGGPVVRGLAPWLDSIARNPTNALAGTAMWLLPIAGGPPETYVPILSEALTNTALASDAAFALALAGARGVPPLLQGLTNPHPAVRGAALAALNPKFRTARPGGHLSVQSDLDRHRWRDGSRNPVRRELEIFATADWLAQLLDQSDAAVRLQIVQLLGRCPPYGAAGLSWAAEDGDEGVRAAARAALRTLDLEAIDGAIVRGPREQKQVALVLTGHEYAEGAETILDELARRKAQAAFFLTGDFLEKPAFRPLVQRICEEGHWLGPHSDKHLLYSSWEDPRTTLVTREQFDSDFRANLNAISRWLQTPMLPKYFVPPYQRCDFHIAAWAGDFFYTVLNPTPGNWSGADSTSEADTNFVSSQAIFDRIVAREQQDKDGLNGFILLFHLGVGMGRADKFHPRFGKLLDYLGSKGYQLVTLDTLINPRLAKQDPASRVVTIPPPAVTSAADEAFRRRYGLSK
jgi:peptidoglycan/xylan/chitin deacetylase (PgdA/CDA1 family)